MPRMPFAIAAIVALLAPVAQAQSTETITVAGGCFWCVEADFEKVGGVIEAVSGFAGGATANPTYEQVTGGGTGHYEAVEITYDPSKVTARQLYDLFFRSIDPTDAGGQFCDRGPSYRTAIFADAGDRQAAEAAKQAAQQALGRQIVTPILGAARFYPADAYHQDYYKSSERLSVSSVGLFVPKSEAYKRYRGGCGRDARVRELWGAQAPFAN
ncbi:peptide-methionine (S)-S-oxide reductase [Limimaricola variabilis]|uniref:Peptide methionine sulfoxide reductase MsrA n=1 Tax=Limimaricola variabilis TaxID=1492771 RepID=A0ABR6HLS6_9RHOB|nr:peptide-methionine (S)-S-oxide reductase MsrA [Limimaricola variabilis]MBB3711371.1 peptide-methionine (S)-S-oxide reductase [Limimaricola variabilis]WPY93654.1 peptide-methionine (S)-S-oxide reductase MsrA [Limimaricola variabilis]